MALGHFLDAFSGRIQDERKLQYDRLIKEDEREFELLDTLARYGSPEIQARAGAALLEMAKGEKGGPTRHKGLRGFLGDMERSSYFPAVSEFLASSQQQVAPPPARPGGGALPSGSPVEPGSQPMSPAGGGVPPEPMFGPPEAAGGAPPEPLASSPGPGMAPLQAAMAPPEPKLRSLFPTAEEIAITQGRGNIEGRSQAITEAIMRAGGTQQDVQNALLGIAGAPRRTNAAVPMMITYIDPATGQEQTGLGTYDATTQQYLVDGQPVQGLSAQRIPSSVPRGAAPRLVRGADGKYVWMTQPDPASVQPGGTVTTNVEFPPPPEPPATSGTATIVGPGGKPVVVERNRGGGLGQTLGEAPTSAGQAKNSDEARQAQVFVSEIEKRISAAIKPAPGAFGSAARPKARTKELMDQITRQVLEEMTGQPHPNATYAEWTQKAAGLTTNKGARSGISPEELDKVLGTLRNLVAPTAAAPPGQVRGSGLPPEPR